MKCTISSLSREGSQKIARRIQVDGKSVETTSETEMSPVPRILHFSCEVLPSASQETTAVKLLCPGRNASAGRPVHQLEKHKITRILASIVESAASIYHICDAKSEVEARKSW